MTTMRSLTIAATALVAVAVAPNASAQFSSTASMLTMTQTWNQNLWASQSSLQKTIERGEKVAAGKPLSGPAPAVRAPQYPLTATDFQAMPWRELPERLLLSTAGSNAGQKSQLRAFYHKLLQGFEGQNRKNNVAAAVAYSIGTSLEITRGRALTQPEVNTLLSYVNDAIVNTPQFHHLTPQQKQLMYEGAVISAGTARALFVESALQSNPALRGQAEELARTILRQWAGS